MEVRGHKTLILAFLPWLALSARADAPFDDQSEVPRVLTPARLDQPISEVPASVTIIDRELIRISGARELHEVLRLVPGMAVAKADGNVPTVSYHGTQARDTRRMLVLIDGRSVYQPGFARVSWNDLAVSLEDVERIEVTRGPASAAYGANAFTGVINIITRDPRDSVGQRVSVRAGNNGIRDARLGASHQFENGAFRVSVSSQRDDGYDAGITPLENGDAKRIDKLNSRTVFELSPRDTLTVHAGGSRSRLDRPPESGLQELADYYDDTHQVGERAFFGLDWQRQFSPRHQLKVSAYGQYTNEDNNLDLCFRDPLTGAQGPGGGLFFSQELRDLYLANNSDIDQTLAAAGTDPGIQNRYATLQASGAQAFCGRAWLDTQETRYDLEIQDTLQVTDWARLVAGANLRHDRGESQAFLSGTGENVSRRLFANLAVKPVAPVTISLGGFWEHDDINGEHFSPRAGINWKVVRGHTLRASYARALRTPDIYEDQARINLPITDLNAPFAGNQQALLGWNPAYFFVTQQSPGMLKPERIRSRELGYYGRFFAGALGGFELDIRYFREELWDLVSGALNPFEFDTANDGEVEHRGTEAQLSWRPNARHLLRLTGAHVHTEANIATEQRFAARDSASALWHWRLGGGWSWSTAYYLARDYNDYPFERLDAQLGFRHRLHQTEVEWNFVVQHPLNKEPVVFVENQYQDDQRYWIGATVTF